MCWFIVAGLLLVLGCGPVSAAERPTFDLSSGFRYNSNLSNADKASDVEDDFFWRADAGATWSRQLDRDWRLSGRVFAGTEIPFQYSAFTLARVGADARVTRKFGLGRTAPKATAGLAFERDFFEDEDMTKWLLQPSVRYQHPLGGDWSLELLYRFDASFARSGLFDGTGNEGALTLRWEPEGRWSFFAGYRLRYGDVVSWATPPRPDLVSVASVVEAGNTVFGRPLTAYRLQALSQTPLLGISFALTPDISLELSGEFQHTSRSAITYDAFLAHLGAKAVF